MDTGRLFLKAASRLKSPVQRYDTVALIFVSMKASVSVSRLSRAPSLLRSTGGVTETFTVRRVSLRVGVERVFPINSPFVEKVAVVRKGKVRRAKLFYLRGRTGKAAKVKSDI